MVYSSHSNILSSPFLFSHSMLISAAISIFTWSILPIPTFFPPHSCSHTQCLSRQLSQYLHGLFFPFQHSFLPIPVLTLNAYLGSYLNIYMVYSSHSNIFSSSFLFSHSMLISAAISIFTWSILPIPTFFPPHSCSHTLCLSRQLSQYLHGLF